MLILRLKGLKKYIIRLPLQTWAVDEGSPVIKKYKLYVQPKTRKSMIFNFQ